MLENPIEKGIKMKDLLQRCVEGMIAHSTKNIRDLLNEAHDHKVVLER